MNCKATNDEKYGVLLAQLGGPEIPTTKAIRSFLKEFLSDPCVIEKQGIKWKIILHCFILTLRPKHILAKYKEIWLADGSPLHVITQKQRAELCKTMQADFPNLQVEYAMRYGNPSLSDGLASLQAKGCTKIVLLPLFPQFSKTTTASVCNFANELLAQTDNLELKTIEYFYNHTSYLNSQAHLINEALGQRPVDYLLLSYHGLPQDSVEKGDPYHDMCLETTKGLLPLIKGIEKDKILHVYQSRFGKKEWLKPYLTDTIISLAAQGTKTIAIACPSFTTDCLETLHEIKIEAKELFLEHGGESLELIPCLNTDPQWIHTMQELLRSLLVDWRS